VAVYWTLYGEIGRNEKGWPVIGFPAAHATTPGYSRLDRRQDKVSLAPNPIAPVTGTPLATAVFPPIIDPDLPMQISSYSPTNAVNPGTGDAYVDRSGQPLLVGNES
jgi:hypothetical protein